MPFDDQAQPAGLMPMGTTEAEVTASPEWGELMSAAFKRENTVGALGVSYAQGTNNPATPYDASFDPWSDIKGYEDFASSFIPANSLEDVARIKAKIDNERHQAELLDAGGWRGTVAQLVAGIADPINLIPVGGEIIKVGRLGERALSAALRVGAVAGGAGLATEGVLQATQETRTISESAVNVAAATLLGGILGGAIGAVAGRDVSALARGLMGDTERLADDMAANTPNSGGPLSAGGSVGAAYAKPTLDELGVARLGGLENALRKTAPTLRTQTSPVMETRLLGQELAEQPLLTKGNLEGKASPVSIESVMRQSQYGLYRAITEADNAFVKYRTGEAGGLFAKARIATGDLFSREQGTLSHDEFLEAVGRAARRGDTSDIPEVAEAARAARKLVLDPFKDAAIRLGIFDEDVDPGTAASYLMRQYNYGKIAAERNKFKNIITDWYESEQGTKAQTQAAIRANLDEMERIRSEFETGKTLAPERVAELENSLERIRDSLESHVLAWQGKSSKAAKSAVARRTAKEAERTGEAPRLAEADRAIMDAAGVISKVNTNLERQELESIAEQTIDRILGTPAGRLPYDVQVPTPGFMRRDEMPDLKARPLKGRVFMIPDHLIEDYLESDISVILKAYTRSMAPDIAMAERGWLDLDSKLREIQLAYEPLRRAAGDDPKALTKLNDQMNEDIRFIKAIWERLRGTYALPANPDGLATRAFRIIRDLNYMRLLGGMTISSLPDAGRVVMQHGFTRIFRDGFAPMVANWKTYRLAAEEVKMSGEALDMVLDTRAMSMADITDDFGLHSKFERGLQTATGKFGVVTLMAPWNAAIKQLVGVISQTRSLQAIDSLTKGTISAGERSRLAQFGIGEDMARIIDKEFKAHGEVHGSLWWANTQAWENRKAAEAYRAALSSEVNQVIVTPGQEKPLWLSTELGKILFQFKSFSLASMHRIALSGLQRRDMAALNGVALMVGLGALVEYLKASPEHQPTNVGGWIAAGVDRSGISGWIFDANNILEKSTRGAVGVSRLVGGPMRSRYASRGVLESLLGPTAGLINDTAQVAGSAATGDWRESDTRAVRRMWPLQNLIGASRLFDAGEEGVNRALGVPMRAKGAGSGEGLPP